MSSSCPSSSVAWHQLTLTTADTLWPEDKDTNDAVIYIATMNGLTSTYSTIRCGEMPYTLI